MCVAVCVPECRDTLEGRLVRSTMLAGVGDAAANESSAPARCEPIGQSCMMVRHGHKLGTGRPRSEAESGKGENVGGQQDDSAMLAHA